MVLMMVANRSARAELQRGARFNGVKVFSATMHGDRDRLGESVTMWLAERPRLEVVDVVVSQSSDEAFHCLAITVFYREPHVSRA